MRWSVHPELAVRPAMCMVCRKALVEWMKLQASLHSGSCEFDCCPVFLSLASGEQAGGQRLWSTPLGEVEGAVSVYEK